MALHFVETSPNIVTIQKRTNNTKLHFLSSYFLTSIFFKNQTVIQISVFCSLFYGQAWNYLWTVSVVALKTVFKHNSRIRAANATRIRDVGNEIHVCPRLTSPRRML